MRNLKVIDTSESGLILADQTVLLWSDVETFGKTERILGAGTVSSYYLIRRATPSKKERVVSISYGFADVLLEALAAPSSGFANRATDRRHLKIKILNGAKKAAHLQLVKKTGFWGNEEPWNIESDLQWAVFTDSREAARLRKEMDRNAATVISIIVLICVSLFVAGHFMKRSGGVDRQPAGPGAASLAGSPTAPGQFLSPSDTNLLFEVTCDKTAASVNEKIQLNYDLYTRYDTRYEGLKSEGDFRGFWIERTVTPKEAGGEVVRVNGKKYVKAPVRERVVAPIYSGDLAIDPGTMKATLTDTGNAAKRTVFLKAKPLMIHVENPSGKSKAAFLDEFCAQHGMKSPPAGIETDKPAVMILLDISGSMLAEDMQPQNRFTSAKVAIKKFLETNTEGMVGLKCFSKDVIRVSPLTGSKAEVVKALQGVQWGAGGEDGTSIGDAIFEALKDLAEYTGNKKAVILLTDGMNNSGHLDPLTAAELAAHHHIAVHAIALGTQGLVPFPVDDPQAGYQKIMVEVGADEKTLAKVAAETGGMYGTARNKEELENLLNEIRKTFSEVP